MKYHRRLQTEWREIARASVTLPLLGVLACSDAGPEALSQGQWPALSADPHSKIDKNILIFIC